MKKVFSLLFVLVFVFTLISCNREKEDVTILYTNDIHGYIANTVKDSNNKEVPALRIDNIAGYKRN